MLAILDETRNDTLAIDAKTTAQNAAKEGFLGLVEVVYGSRIREKVVELLRKLPYRQDQETHILSKVL